METSEIISLMTRLEAENKADKGEPVFNEDKLDTIVQELKQTYEEISKSVFSDFNCIAAVTEFTPEWKFVSLNFYCLHLLKEQTNKNALISVTNTKLLKKCVKNIVDIGIFQNVVPTLPFYQPSKKIEVGVKEKYYMLRANVLGLHYYTFSSLGYYLIDITISGLLLGLFQLSFCPIIKPSENQRGSFIMTNEFFNEVTADQKLCREILLSVRAKVSTYRFFFNLALLMRDENPKWFKAAIERHLVYCLKQPIGVKTIFSLMDEQKDYQISHIGNTLGSLVSRYSKSEDFDSTILPQVNDLLYENLPEDKHIFVFGDILRHTYKSNVEKGLIILEQLFSPLKNLTNNNKSSNINAQETSNGLISAIKLITYVFVNSMEALPFELIRKYVAILFNIYMFLENSSPLADNLKSTLVKYFQIIDEKENNNLLDNFIFNMENPELLVASKNLKISVNSNNLVVNFNEKNIKCDVLKSARSVLSLFDSERLLCLRTFTFLLNCLLESKKYFPDVSLLETEDEGYLSVFETKIAVFEMLQTLSSKQEFENYFKNGFPKELLKYFNAIFEKALKTGAHKNTDHEDHQSVFTTALILESIFQKKFPDDQPGLIKTIKVLHDKTDNNELKTVLSRILKISSIEEETRSKQEDDEIEENIKCLLSDCIATQGHGLIALKKMIISKHPKAVERKQLIFTMFKNKLSHRDSYIYLAAINGLASIADQGTQCTTMVLKTLCEEYMDFPTEEFGDDATEMRLKIGEVLVKITKNLGEMAPYYKSLLLNTFLAGTKDEDPLVRASSLSNLGEICRVLGAKLGTIITEVLHCAHSIFSSDKHDEPRRAAVMVIQQLLAGLGKDMITGLQYDIQTVYRTLKYLHQNDKDDVLKLHCELALLEINKNMTEILTPQYEMNAEKKVVVLN